MKDSHITPEHIFLSRRQFLKRAGTLLAGLAVASACGRAGVTLSPTAAPSAVPTAARSAASALTDEFGDPLTPLAKARAFGNYYEFTRAKQGISQMAKDLQSSPWQVEIGGLVAKPRVLDLDDLRRIGQEERIYRMRCVEAWSMVIPWQGFALHKLLELVEPQPGAKWVRFESIMSPEQMPGQDPAYYATWIQTAPPADGEASQCMSASLDPASSPYVWPYVEALRLDEAMHDLTMLATGMYGQPLPPENGAPVRLVVPWKYGFKSAKAVVRIDLVAEQPVTFWVKANPKELGFWANVNPDVPHPLWSQGREKRFLGQDPEPILPTLPFNGYAEQVAALYTGMDLKVNF